MGRIFRWGGWSGCCWPAGRSGFTPATGRPMNLTFSYPRWDRFPRRTRWPGPGWRQTIGLGSGNLPGPAPRRARCGGCGAVFYGDARPGGGFHHALHVLLFVCGRPLPRYVACIGLIALASAGLTQAVGRAGQAEPGWPMLRIGIAAFAGSPDVEAGADLRGSETLWLDTVAKNPASWLGITISAPRAREGPD